MVGAWASSNYRIWQRYRSWQLSKPKKTFSKRFTWRANRRQRTPRRTRSTSWIAKRWESLRRKYAYTARPSIVRGRSVTAFCRARSSLTTFATRSCMVTRRRRSSKTRWNSLLSRTISYSRRLIRWSSYGEPFTRSTVCSVATSTLIWQPSAFQCIKRQAGIWIGSFRLFSYCRWF